MCEPTKDYLSAESGIGNYMHVLQPQRQVIPETKLDIGWF